MTEEEWVVIYFATEGKGMTRHRFFIFGHHHPRVTEHQFITTKQEPTRICSLLGLTIPLEILLCCIKQYCKRPRAAAGQMLDGPFIRATL